MNFWYKNTYARYETSRFIIRTIIFYISELLCSSLNTYNMHLHINSDPNRYLYTIFNIVA